MRRFIGKITLLLTTGYHLKIELERGNEVGWMILV